MDVDFLWGIAEVLQKTGPWGLVVVLGIAYWKTRGEVRALYERIGALAEQQTASVLRMENALQELREVITYAFLRRATSTPPKARTISETK